ncbi:hypothetical protein ACIGHB_12450 [Streptomyces sp. NPDC085460]|uniref:hypothetical protein n=1 Tax=Streptomyces sp. NPDC085460 TaxID=3365723 RepID=UPI0037D247F6
MRRARTSPTGWRSPPARRAVLGLLPVHLCPGPRPAHERDALARHATVLLDGLAEAEGEARDGLIGLLETVADRPAVGERVVRAVRALPARRPGRRSVLPLLRAAGAVLVRADLDRALTATALDPDPKRAGTALLRETFGVAGPAVPSEWRRELAAATGDVRALAAHRSRGTTPGSRELLAALADVHADAPPDVRAALVDWMTDLQPLGAPPWTLAEDARAGAAAPRAVHPADLDQPRSAAQRERLLALLASGTPRQRNTAAHALLSWPEPEARAAALDAYLRGRTDAPADRARLTALGRALTEADPVRLLDEAGGVRPDRVARIAATSLDARQLQALLPVLLRLWLHGPESARADACGALRQAPADALAGHLEHRLAAGESGLLELVAGRALQRTPLLDRLAERHPGARLVLVDGPLPGPDAAERRTAALRALRERAPVPVPAGSSASSDEEPAALLRSPEPARIRRALARLTEGSLVLDPARLEELVRELLTHPETGVRLHAHRTSRVLLDRETHLRLTERLLGDARPDVVRTAIRVLSQARWTPALPAFVALLGHGRATVRRAAEEAVLRAGPDAVPLLRRAVSRARPDRRAGYERLLERIREAESR